MCFLGEPFKHDLFISYSHGAFKGQHDPDLKLWSRKFADALRAELAGIPEFEKISVFLDQSERSDESVDRTADLTTHLQEHVHDSALLTILMTPHYLRSQWCSQEREWWCAKHNPDTLGAGERIFVCRVLPTGEVPWPPELPAAAGYDCYDLNKEPDYARPFTWMDRTDDRNEYVEVLISLSGDMRRRLRNVSAAVKKRRERDEADARLAADVGQVIYLHARERHAEAWERAGERLAQNGFVILPLELAPMARDPKAIREIAERRIETLSGCDGLLLLGTEDGQALDADIVVVGRQDRESARARSDRLLPCAVLNTNGQGIATTKRKAMAHKLRIDWIDTIGQVQSWLHDSGGAGA